MPALRAFMSAFVSVVNGVFGSSPDVLADFGIPASCPRPYARGEGGGRREARFNPRGAAHDGIEAEGYCRTLGSRADGASCGGVTRQSSANVVHSDNGSSLGIDPEQSGTHRPSAETT
jgi:hypothetical protein